MNIHNLLDQLPPDYSLFLGKHSNGNGYHAAIVQDETLEPEGWADASHGLTLEETLQNALKRFNKTTEWIYVPEDFGINSPGDTHEQTI